MRQVVSEAIWHGLLFLLFFAANYQPSRSRFVEILSYLHAGTLPRRKVFVKMTNAYSRNILLIPLVGCRVLAERAGY